MAVITSWMSLYVLLIVYNSYTHLICNVEIGQLVDGTKFGTRTTSDRLQGSQILHLIEVSFLLTYELQHGRNINPYPTEFPFGNGMVLHFYQQQESSTTKTVHKVINKRLKTYV